jgi:hypothetical protein
MSFKEKLEEQSRKDPRYLPGDMIAIEIGAKAALLIAAEAYDSPRERAYTVRERKVCDELRALAREMEGT